MAKRTTPTNERSPRNRRRRQKMKVPRSSGPPRSLNPTTCHRTLLRVRTDVGMLREHGDQMHSMTCPWQLGAGWKHLHLPDFRLESHGRIGVHR